MTSETLKILLVEDNPDHAELIRRVLARQSRPIEVATVAGGAECLDLLERHSYSAVLLDNTLPGMDGLTVLKEIRRQGNPVPVIMVTGQGDEAVVVKAMEEGASDYLIKATGYLTTLPAMLFKVLKQQDLALDNARLYEGSKQRAQEQAALNAVAMAISQSLRQDELLEIALDKVLEVTERERASIRLKDATTNEIVLAAHRGFTEREVETLRGNLSHEISRQVLESGQPRIINDRANLQGSESLLPESRSVAWIPIRARRQVIGVLGVSAARPIPFIDREVEFLQAIGNIIGVALENARLYDKERSQVKSLRLLVEASQKLVERVTIDTLAQDILDTVVTAFEVKLAWIGSAEDDGLVRPLYWAGDVADYLRKVEIRWDDSPLGQGPAGRAIRTGRPVIMDVANDPGFAPWREPALAHGYREVAAFPLMRGAKPFGHLILYSAELNFFTVERVELLQTYANIATAALEGARLFEETERRAHEQAVLSSIAMATSQSLHRDELLEITLDKVLEATGRKRVNIRLKDSRTGDISMASHRGFSEAEIEELRRRTTHPASDKVFVSGEPFILNETESNGVQGFLQETQSVAWIPIKAESEVIGVLGISDNQSKPFAPGEVKLLEAIGSVIGVSIENARLFEETERRGREQAALYAVTAAVSGSFDLEQILLKGLDAVLEATGLDGGYIQYVEENPARITLRAHRGMSEAFIERIRNRQRPGTNASRVVATGEALVLDNIPSRHSGRFQGENITAAAWVPIISKEKTIGIIVVGSRTIPAFPRRQLPLLSSIGNALGVALENARLFQETKRSLDRIGAMQEIDRAISSTLDLRQVLDILLEKIDVTLPYASATIRLFNKDSSRLEPVACRNLDEKEWMADRWKSGRGIANVVFETKAPLIIRNVQTDARVLDIEFYRKHKLTSYLGVPLIVKDEVLGALSFYTKEEHDFRADEIDFLATLAGQAAIAIQNSQLYENARLRETQLQETNRMLAALHGVAAAASQSFDLDRVLKVTIEKITELFRFDATQVHIYNEHTDELVLGAFFESEPNRFTSVQSFRRGHGVVGKVAESGTPLIFEDVQIDPLYQRLTRTRVSDRFGYHFFAAFPVRGKRKILGTVACSGAALRKLAPSEIQLLESMTDQIAVAIENNQLYEQLKQKVEELERANKIKDEFLSVMSHELRTPLNVVIGYAGLIREGMLGETNPDQNKALDKLVSRTNDLLGMIVSMLNATSIEANEIRIESSDFALSELLDEIKTGCERSLAKPLKINWVYAADLPVIASDRDKLKSILQNLINNAVKFTESGQVTISTTLMENGKQISASVKPEERRQSALRWVELKVADTGVGIAKEKLPIIFEKFRQADSSETRPYGGIGLGLYIAKNFTELLGGRIELETEVGKGSTFTVKLPCLCYSSAATDRRDDPSAAPSAAHQLH